MLPHARINMETHQTTDLTLADYLKLFRKDVVQLTELRASVGELLVSLSGQGSASRAQAMASASGRPLAVTSFMKSWSFHFGK